MKNKEYKFAFVVLHYITVQDTIECVESILNNIDYQNYIIIIVDNGSKNNSGELLKNKYSDNPKIKVIISKKNLGFAKGNNLGYNFAKYKMDSDFIALINNDTILEQKNFITKIVDKYTNVKFHILGPDILSTKDGIHQNPRPLTLQKKDEIGRASCRERV